MVNFLIYDVVLLVAFAIFVSIFLHKNKSNLKREGLLILYGASWGIKLIDYVGNKYRRTLKVLSYVSITVGYVLMGFMIYFLGRIVWIYMFNAGIVRAIKVPPIIPLVPYLPQVFKLDFLPDFFFIYWIIILAIIAITHEFAHGIFAAYNKIKVKTTGFGFFPYFLPVFLAAFVELDEEKMAKHKKFEQLAILSAGTFANVLTAILFLFVFWGFFALAFTPAGVQFDSYAYGVVALSNITMVNGVDVSNPSYDQVLELTEEVGYTEFVSDDFNYISNKEFLERQKGREILVLYGDAPAIRNDIGKAITSINGVEISGREGLSQELSKYSPGEEIKVTSINDEIESEDLIVLGTHPGDLEKSWLGIVFLERDDGRVLSKINNWFTSFKEPYTYYEPKWDFGSVFVYSLLWWLVLISISVALVNMLPVGIFDGGRFFYLTVLGITKSENIAKKAFSFMTYLFLFLIAVLMAFWVISFI